MHSKDVHKQLVQTSLSRKIAVVETFHMDHLCTVTFANDDLHIRKIITFFSPSCSVQCIHTGYCFLCLQVCGPDLAHGCIH